MEKISIATELNKAFEKDYAFLLDENWTEGSTLPKLWSGLLKLNTSEAANILYQIEASTSSEQKSLLKKYTKDEKKLYMRYMIEKGRGRFKPFPVLASASYMKGAKATKPAVIFLFVVAFLSIMFNWLLWLKIIFGFLFVWFLSSYFVALNDTKRAKKMEDEQYF